jgi:hypothetical protein
VVVLDGPHDAWWPNMEWNLGTRSSSPSSVCDTFVQTQAF